MIQRRYEVIYRYQRLGTGDRVQVKAVTEGWYLLGLLLVYRRDLTMDHPHSGIIIAPGHDVQ